MSTGRVMASRVQVGWHVFHDDVWHLVMGIDRVYHHLTADELIYTFSDDTCSDPKTVTQWVTALAPGDWLTLVVNDQIEALRAQVLA